MIQFNLVVAVDSVLLRLGLHVETRVQHISTLVLDLKRWIYYQLCLLRGFHIDSKIIMLSLVLLSFRFVRYSVKLILRF